VSCFIHASLQHVISICYLCRAIVIICSCLAAFISYANSLIAECYTIFLCPECLPNLVKELCLDLSACVRSSADYSSRKWDTSLLQNVGLVQSDPLCCFLVGMSFNCYLCYSCLSLIKSWQCVKLLNVLLGQ
jgi:hypothetical protein